MHTISPIHIGSGEMLETSNYVLREDNGKYYGYVYSINQFIQLLDAAERQEYLEYCRNLFKQQNNCVTDLIKYRNYFDRYFNYDIHKNAVKYTTNIPSYELYNNITTKYRNSQNSNNVFNQLQIKSIYKDSKNTPYIPGSSLKGMIRHAFIKQNQIKNNKQRYYMNEYENKDFFSALFSMLLVSDSINNLNSDISIMYIKHLYINGLDIQQNKKNYNRPYNGQSSYAEFIPSNIDGFNLNIKVQDKTINNKDERAYDTFIKSFDTHQSFINMLNQYFSDKVNKIYNMYKTYFGEKHEFVSFIDRFRGKYGDKVAFINIGRYGGLFIKDGREKYKLKYMRHAATINFKENDVLQLDTVFPIGWVAVYPEE